MGFIWSNVAWRLRWLWGGIALFLAGFSYAALRRDKSAALDRLEGYQRTRQILDAVPVPSVPAVDLPGYLRGRADQLRQNGR